MDWPGKWNEVDDYITDLLLPEDEVLETVLKMNEAAGLPAHNVSPNQGKFLQLLASIHMAKNILEIGTLGGYSTIWLARALPEDGKIITLELDPKHAEMARTNVEYAGLSEVVEVRVGLALDTLAELAIEGCGPFDLIFIDADKPNNPEYLEWALKLSRPGSIIIGDNVVRDGKVTDHDSTDASVQGIRRFYERISDDPRLEATALQTVGCKGYDGFLIAIVQDVAKG